MGYGGNTFRAATLRFLANVGVAQKLASENPRMNGSLIWLSKGFRDTHLLLSTKLPRPRLASANFVGVPDSRRFAIRSSPIRPSVIDPALQLMMDAVHRYEGYAAQALGDGILGLARGKGLVESA